MTTGGGLPESQPDWWEFYLMLTWLRSPSSSCGFCRTDLKPLQRRRRRAVSGPAGLASLLLTAVGFVPTTSSAQTFGQTVPLYIDSTETGLWLHIAGAQGGDIQPFSIEYSDSFLYGVDSYSLSLKLLGEQVISAKPESVTGDTVRNLTTPLLRWGLIEIRPQQESETYVARGAEKRRISYVNQLRTGIDR